MSSEQPQNERLVSAPLEGGPIGKVEHFLRADPDGPSWWPIVTKEKWQDATQGLNFPLTMRLRAEIKNTCWSPASLGAYHELPEWLVMCLIGMPTDRWWHHKVERDCPQKVRLP